MKKKRGDIFLSQYAMLREDIIVYISGYFRPRSNFRYFRGLAFV